MEVVTTFSFSSLKVFYKEARAEWTQQEILSSDVLMYYLALTPTPLNTAHKVKLISVHLPW